MRNVVLAILLTSSPVPAAEALSPARQTALVKQYCAVCHTDVSQNGGLSLEHYDASAADPALAAMLLSKLRNGAMGAAGRGVPDKPTQDAWVAATTEQAGGSDRWSVIRTGGILKASIVREVPPRAANESGASLYRLTLACEGKTGEARLTWAPAPQTDRAFYVSADDGPAVPYKLEGRETMGNGAALTSGLAAAVLRVPVPERTVTVTGLFPGETVVFPLDGLDRETRHELRACSTAER